MLKLLLLSQLQQFPYISRHLNCLACALIVACLTAMDAMRATERSIEVKQRKLTFMHSAAFIMQCVSGFPYPTQLIEQLSAQIFFNNVPFHESNNLQVLRLVTAGKRPQRLEKPRMEDDVWDLIRSCMETIPPQRPTMESIVRTVTSFVQAKP